MATLAATFAISPAKGEQSSYPERPITLVVTYLSGSAPDVIARVVAPSLSESLGQPVVVENKAGAGGTIGLASVARARNDGYTLGLVSPATIATAPAMYRNLSYDPLKDFSAVIKLATTPGVLLVPNSSPAKSTQDLIKLMKEKKSVLYASTGVGTTQHLQGALLGKLANVQAVHVPYRRQGDQLIGLVRGEVDFSFSSLPGSINFVRDGRLRALGVTTPMPSPSLPEVPSLSAAELKGFEKSTLWFGIVVPSGTADPIVEKLHRAFVKALMTPDVQAKLLAVGFDPAPPAPASEFDDFIRDQVPFWTDLVRISGASVE